MNVEDLIIPTAFKPLALFSAGLWGWIINLLCLKKFGIDSVPLLQMAHSNQNAHLHSIINLSYILTAIILVNLALYSNGHSTTFTVFAYTLSLALLLWPGRFFYRKERARFIRTIYRVFSLKIYSTVYFSDIVFADILTSFSNVFGDTFFVLLSCQSYMCFIPPLLKSLPFLIRLKQCVSEYLETKKKKHILNALKYIISISVISTSATTMGLKEEGSVFQLWLLCAIINSVYSFCWDVIMDWSLFAVTQSSPPRIHFRQQLYFSRPLWYNLAILANLILRFAWCSQIYSATIDPLYSTPLEILEITRRLIWVLFRLENEWVKKMYNTLPNAPLEKLQMSFIDRRTTSSLLSPIVEED